MPRHHASSSPHAQLRFALQMPALFLMHAGNALLLPGDCKHGAGDVATAAVTACVAMR